VTVLPSRESDHGRKRVALSDGSDLIEATKHKVTFTWNEKGKQVRQMAPPKLQAAVA